MWLLWVNSLALWVTGGAVVLFMTFLLLSRLKLMKTANKRHYDVTQKEIIAGIVAEALPIHPNAGWALEGGKDGLRIFSKHLNSLQHYSSTQVVAASLIVDVSAKRALSLITSLRELPCWFFGLPYSASSPPSLVKPASTNSHILQFTMRNHPHGLLAETVWAVRSKVANWTSKYAPVLEGYVSAPQKIKTENLERYWCSRTDGLSYVFSEPRAPSSLPYTWCCIYLTSLRQPGVCLVTMAMCPSQPVVAASVSCLITGHLCALREHITMRSFKAYSRHHPSNKSSHAAKTSEALSTETSPAVSGKGVESGEVTGVGEVTGSGMMAGIGSGDSLGSQPGTASIVAELTSTPPVSPILNGNEPVVSTPPAIPASPILNGNEPVVSIPASPEAILNAKYLTVAEVYTNKLIAMANEGLQDGWIEMGTNKNVHRMKKPPDSGGPPINNVKGFGTIKAPPEFVLRLLKDPAHATTLDELLKEARVLERISNAVALAHLLYKAVWPTSPRDLSLLSISGKVDATSWVSSGTSVVDPRIPHEKGYVRAELLGGGYIIQSIPDQPEWSGVTYVACVDLKGSIPSFVVNKIAESQPMCVNNLRNLAEPLYQQMKNDPQKLAAFEEQHPISLVFTVQEEVAAKPAVSATLEDRIAHSEWHYDPAMDNQVPIGWENGRDDSPDGRNGFQTPLVDSNDHDGLRGDSHQDDSPPPSSAVNPPPSNPPPRPTSSPPSSHSSDSVFHSSHSDSLLQQHMENGVNGVSMPARSQSLSSAALRLSPYTLTPSQQSSSHLQSITKENIYYPRSDSGQVDYRTMANQTAARVLEEVFHVSGLDLLNSSTFTNKPSGGWSFAGLEKDVLLLSKTTPGQPFSSFMGKGIIPLSPDFVFNSLRNPQLRFMYDNMLKDLHIVKHIEEGLFILHLHHETTQCFIKQARDFCILVSERCEPKKNLLTGISVETPHCPPNAALHRGKIHCSGWVVEPKQVNGKVCAEVTYLLQVDVGGVPSTLVNFISKRQPLAVAYLRDYLVATSLEQSIRTDQ